MNMFKSSHVWFKFSHKDILRIVGYIARDGLVHMVSFRILSLLFDWFSIFFYLPHRHSTLLHSLTTFETILRGKPTLEHASHVHFRMVWICMWGSWLEISFLCPSKHSILNTTNVIWKFVAHLSSLLKLILRFGSWSTPDVEDFDQGTDFAIRRKYLRASHQWKWIL
jgi:hypothetical protein